MRSAYLTFGMLLLATTLAAESTDAVTGVPLIPGAAPPAPRLHHPGQAPASGEPANGSGGKGTAARNGKGSSGPGPGPAGGKGAAKGPKAEVKKAKGAKDPAGTSGEEGAKPADDQASAKDPIENDSIILVNEQRFQGTVLADQPDPAQVAINTGSGILRIRRELVARVEYGLVARMARVKDDDLAGLVDLAHWCRINRRNPEALQLLTKAVALPGCDVPTRGFYAQLVDEIEGPEKALPLYIGYRNAGGTDPDILARLDVLEKAHTAWEEQMRALGLDPGASAESGKPVVAATASNVDEGLEKYTWGGDPKWANPVKTSSTTLVTPDGPRKVLQVDYEPATVPPEPGKALPDKAAVVLQRPLTLRAGTKLTFLAANRTSKDVRIGIAVKTGTDWVYFESQQIPLTATSSGQEFVQLSFDLGGSNFKTAATSWAYSSKIANLDQVHELQILIHNGHEKGSLWLAGIAFADGQ